MLRRSLFFSLLLAVVAVPATAQRFSDWTAPVHLAYPNSIHTEVEAYVSKDGLSLYFACSDCPGGLGSSDLYVSRRAAVDQLWGLPENLGPTVNSAYAETNPTLSIDGHSLYFASDRPDGLGASDLYVSRRHNKRDDFGWRAPQNLGPGVNSDANEDGVALFEDENTGETVLYFASNRPGGPGGFDIYAATLQPDETFGQAVLVPGLNSPRDDRGPTIRRDGLEILFTSNRTGSILNLQLQPSYDIWTATRPSSADPWSTPVNVDPSGALGVNTGKHDGGPSLSFDGETMYFQAAQRPGNFGVGCPNAATCFFDIWVTTRTKLPDQD